MNEPREENNPSKTNSNKLDLATIIDKNNDENEKENNPEIKNIEFRKITQTELFLLTGLFIVFFSLLNTWLSNSVSISNKSGTSYFTGQLAVVSSMISMMILLLPFFKVKLTDFIENLEYSEEKIVFYSSFATSLLVFLTIIWVLVSRISEENNSIENGFFLGLISLIITFYSLFRYNKEKNIKFFKK